MLEFASDYIEERYMEAILHLVMLKVYQYVLSINTEKFLFKAPLQFITLYQ